MKLQFNDTGAWRQVLNFPEDRLADVKKAACALAAIAGNNKLRILEDDGVTVYGYCTYPANDIWSLK